MQPYAQYSGLMAPPVAGSADQPELLREESGADDLLGLLPRSLLASPTMDECNGVDTGGAADRAPASPFPAMHHFSSDVPHQRGPDNDRGGSVLDGKPPPAMQLGGGGGMSIETERVLAYLTQRGKAALAAAAGTKDQQRVQEGAAPRDSSNTTSSEGTTEGPQPTAALFAAASHVASLPAFLQPEPMLPPAPSPAAVWGGGSGGGMLPGAAMAAAAQQPYVPAASNACIGSGLLGPASEDLARRLGLPLPPPPGSELAAMAAAAWGWAAAATRRGSGGSMLGQPRSMAAGGFGPLMQPNNAAAAPVPPFFLPSAAPFFGSGAGSAAGGMAHTEGFDCSGLQPAALASRHLWCGNVMVADAETLAGTFRPFGPLESVRVFAGRTYAFVNFVFEEHAAAAKAALEMQVLPELTSAAPLLVRFQTKAKEQHCTSGFWIPK